MEFRVLGPLEVVRDGDTVDLGAPRLRLLLALLLARGGEVVSADRLVEDLWDGRPPETARHTLQGYVYRLRRALGPDGWRLESCPPGYRLKVSPDELDAQRFQDLADAGRAALGRGDGEQAGEALREALLLWRGPALADLPDVAALQPEQARFEGMRLTALEDRIEADLASGRHGALVDELESLVAEDPFRERLWGHLMVALYRAGRQADALRAFRAAREELGEQLGIEPSPWLCRLEEQILLHHPDLGEPARLEMADPPHNLPSQRTSFVGRHREVADLVGLLAANRLVTITGPPGAGKTRVAVEAAAASLVDHPHGACFVSLAELEDAELFPSQLAAALGLPTAEQPALDAVVDHVKVRRLLLVLDNFEHVLPAAATVSALLDAAPGSRILVTSRAPLHLSGEQEYPLAPLAVPDPGAAEAADETGALDALALFADRARAVDPSFTLTAENARVVSEIVARVDGLPLAVELAAARLRHVPLHELRDRLETALPVLTEGPIDRPVRHRELRDAIAWSDEQLDPPEQRLFRRLGVFRGGFSLDAATAVVDGLADDGEDVTRGVHQLVEANLVRAPADDDLARYSMLTTIREYALERLRAEGEEDEVSRRHAEVYAALAAEAEPELTRSDQARWLRRLAAEHADLRAALTWAERAGEIELALVTAGRLWRYWHFRGRLAEGRSLLEDLLALAGDAPTIGRVKGLVGLAGLCYWQGELEAAEAGYRTALDALERRAAASGQDTEDASPKDPLLAPWWLEFEALLGLVVTIACHRGDPEEAAPVEERFQALVAEHPEHPLAAGAGLATSGLMRLFTGDLEGSRECNEAVVAATREIGERWYEAQTLRTLALTSMRQGRYERAEQELLDSIALARELADLPSMAMDLDRLGQVAAASGRSERSVVLAGAAERLREEAGAGLGIDDFRWETEHPRDAARRLLDETEIEVAWARGRTMSEDEVLAYAREALSRSQVG